MRSHILRLMDIDDGKALPPSHVSGAPLKIDEPVRFIWDRTTKKHAHNKEMKSRVIKDILVRRDLYPLVPDQEFTEIKLDAAFENAYTSLRQKYNSQTSKSGRGDAKVQKSRRLERKKTVRFSHSFSSASLTVP